MHSLKYSLEAARKLLDFAYHLLESAQFHHFYCTHEHRHLILREILQPLNGRHEKSKGTYEKSFNAWNYSIRGLTLDSFDLTVIVSFDEEQDLLIITVFYIERGKKI